MALAEAPGALLASLGYRRRENLVVEVLTGLGLLRLLDDVAIRVEGSDSQGRIAMRDLTPLVARCRVNEAELPVTLALVEKFDIESYSDFSSK